MDKIVGLGRATKALTDGFGMLPEYKTYFFDEEVLGDHLTMEAYEEGFPSASIKRKIKGITKKSEVLLLVEGGAPITGATLSLLEMLCKASVSVLYIEPELDMLSLDERENEALLFRALQGLALTGVLDHLYLISRPAVESTLGEVALDEVEDEIVAAILNTFAMTNFYEHTDPIKYTEHPIPDGIRIVSFGYLFPDGSETDLYQLEGIKDKKLYYGVPEESIKDTSLLGKIKSKVKEVLDSGSRCSYSVYQIEGLVKQSFVRNYTDFPQERRQKSSFAD